jgi:hypothetical protein
LQFIFICYTIANLIYGVKYTAEIPLFAVNYALEKVGHVEVGDDVFVEFDA